MQGPDTGPLTQARRLVLTSAALLERRTDTYEVAERRPLAGVAALVRFLDEPQCLALEWTDGALPAVYLSPARESLLAAVLDAAQVGHLNVPFGPLLTVFGCHLLAMCRERSLYHICMPALMMPAMPALVNIAPHFQKVGPLAAKVNFTAIQVAAGRPIPVLPHPVPAGFTILANRPEPGVSLPVHFDPELEKLTLAHLGAACKEASAALSREGTPADANSGAGVPFGGCSLRASHVLHTYAGPCASLDELAC